MMVIEKISLIVTGMALANLLAPSPSLAEETGRIFIMRVANINQHISSSAVSIKNGPRRFIADETVTTKKGKQYSAGPAASRTCSDELKACEGRCVTPYGFKGAALSKCMRTGCGGGFKLCMRTGVWINQRQNKVLTDLVKK